MSKPIPDLTLEQCDELRRMTEYVNDKGTRGEMTDDEFEAAAEATAAKCNGDFSPENWRKSLRAVYS